VAGARQWRRAREPPLRAAEEVPVRTDGPERRRFSRRSTTGLAGRIGFLQPLRVLDLSAQGARVRTAESLSPGRRYHFQLATLNLTAAVARCALVHVEADEHGARAVFEAGLAFDPLTATQRRQLRQVTASSATAG
jgi:hypothetical protein